MSRARLKPAASPKALSGYHGTSSLFERDIVASGLRPFREEGGIYFSPFLGRAEIYATAWAVGLHPAGLTPSAQGVVFRFPIPGNALLRQEQRFDFAIKSKARHVTVASRIDCSRLSRVERLGHLFNFLGILACEQDAYLTELPFDRKAVRSSVAKIIHDAPQADLQAGVDSTPTI